MRFFLLALALFSSSLAWAGEDTKPLHRADFAYGVELSVSGQGAIYGLAIPPQVYQACTRADLGDLRVFNSQGVIPHFIRPQVRKKNTPQPVVLPFFPLMDTVANKGYGKGVTVNKDGSRQSVVTATDLHIETDENGTIIDFHQSRGPNQETAVTSYIIDTTSLKKKADWLDFSWTGQGDHFSTSVHIEASDDLSNWRTVVRKASLAELRFAGHDLLRNRIKIRNWQKKYLRISWPAGEKGILLTAVKAGYSKEHVAYPRTVHHLAGERQPSSKDGKVVYHYTSDGYFPVDQLNVRLGQHNSLAQVTISSRDSEEGPWRHRAQFLAYQLTIDAVSLDSNIKRISPSTDRFWRLEMDAVGSGSSVPMLQVGWLPQQLVFVAQGQGPYTLAYGRAGLGPERSQVNRLLTSIDPKQEKDLIRPAYAGGQVILGGKGQLLPAPEIPWRRWLLWASLVAGVLVIGNMALQLFKEMQAAGKEE